MEIEIDFKIDTKEFHEKEEILANGYFSPLTTGSNNLEPPILEYCPLPTFCLGKLGRGPIRGISPSPNSSENLS